MEKLTISSDLQSKNDVSSLSPEVIKSSNSINDVSLIKKKIFPKHPMISRKSPLYGKFRLEDNLQNMDLYNTQPSSAGFFPISTSKLSKGTTPREKESLLTNLGNIANRSKLQEQIDARNLNNKRASLNDIDSDSLNNQTNITKDIDGGSERKPANNFTFYHKKKSQNSSNSQSFKNSCENLPSISPNSEIMFNLNQILKSVKGNQNPKNIKNLITKSPQIFKTEDNEKSEILTKNSISPSKSDTHELISNNEKSLSQYPNKENLNKLELGSPLILSNLPTLKFTITPKKNLLESKISEKLKKNSPLTHESLIKFEKTESNISTNLDKDALSVLIPGNTSATKLDLGSLKFSSLSTIEYPEKSLTPGKKKIIDPLFITINPADHQSLYSTANFLRNSKSDFLKNIIEPDIFSKLKFDTETIDVSENTPKNQVNTLNQTENNDHKIVVKKIDVFKIKSVKRPQSLTRPTYNLDMKIIAANLSEKKGSNHRRELSAFTKLGAVANRFEDGMSTSKQKQVGFSNSEKKSYKRFDFNENEFPPYSKITEIPGKEATLNTGDCGEQLGQNVKKDLPHQVGSTVSSSLKKDKFSIGMQNRNVDIINSRNINSRLKKRINKIDKEMNLTNSHNVSTIIGNSFIPEEKNEILHGRSISYNINSDTEASNTMEMDKMRLEINKLYVVN